EDGRPQSLEQVHGARRVVSPRGRGADDQQDGVDEGADDGGIGYREQRWGVDDDGVVVTPPGGEELAEGGSREEFRRVEDVRAAGDDVQVLDRGRLNDLVDGRHVAEDLDEPALAP